MPVRYQNYLYRYERKGKPVFAPSKICRRVGEDICKQVRAAHAFDDVYYHLAVGGHVAAIHSHRANRFFAKIDLANFFCSVGRNRIVRSLKDIGIPRAGHYARWSTVKNPYQGPSYALPYGFVQSPLLATLVLDQSPLGSLLKDAKAQVTIAVYVDDISLSCNDLNQLRSVFEDVVTTVDVAGFQINNNKTAEPTDTMQIFNCDMRQGFTSVTDERILKFEAEVHSRLSEEAFDLYVERVRSGNL